LATLPLMSKTDAQNSSTPWYVSNYLRDTSQKGLPRMPRWHHVRNQVKACKIGKAGTKQWDKVFGGEGMPCTSCAHAVYMLRAWTLSPVYLPYLTTRSLTTPIILLLPIVIIYFKYDNPRAIAPPRLLMVLGACV